MVGPECAGFTAGAEPAVGGGHFLQLAVSALAVRDMHARAHFADVVLAPAPNSASAHSSTAAGCGGVGGDALRLEGRRTAPSCYRDVSLRLRPIRAQVAEEPV